MVSFPASSSTLRLNLACMSQGWRWILAISEWRVRFASGQLRIMKITEEIFCSPAFRSCLIENLTNKFSGSENVFYTMDLEKKEKPCLSFKYVSTITKKKHVFILKDRKNKDPIS